MPPLSKILGGRGSGPRYIYTVVLTPAAITVLIITVLIIFHYNAIRNSRLADASVTLYHHAVVEDARAHNFISHVAYSESAYRLRLPHGGFFLVLFVRVLIRFLRVKA